MKSHFEKSVEWSIVILFSAFCLVMVLQIVGRSIFNASLFWSEEFSRYCFVWVILLSSGIAIKRKAHVGFDLIIEKLPAKVQYVIYLINDILIGIFLLLFFINGLELTLSVGSTPSPSLKIPMAVIYSILPLSALVMLVFLIESSWKTIRYGIINPATDGD